MAIRVTETAMTSDETGHNAGWWPNSPANGDGAWVVSWLPHRLLTRNEAMTAMTLAEHITRTSADADDPLVITWSAELMIEPDIAVRVVRTLKSRYPLM
jgi:hypothetical protein